MRLREIIREGGWASSLTQDTIITPATVAEVVDLLNHLEPRLNRYLESQGLPPAEIGRPGGSATYYLRDLKLRPDVEYGDVDIQFHVEPLPDLSDSATMSTYQQAIKEFADAATDISSSNGVNLILKIPQGYVQIDLIYSYMKAKNWILALAPEWKVKGVLCNSLYSSLGEALNLSFGGGHGVQAKFLDGELVPFRVQKGTTLKTITLDPHNWAIDIAKFFGAKKFSTGLKKYPGLLDEVRVSDIIQSIRGIAETLEQNKVLPPEYSSASDLLNKVKQIYLGKIQKARESTKFQKAQTARAQAQAEKTKTMLSQKSQEFAELF